MGKVSLRRVGRLAGWGALAAFGVLVMRTMARGLMSAYDSSDFPDALAVKLDALPVIFPLHMVTGALALPLVALAAGLGEWEPQRRWHRRLARLAALDVLVAGVTAWPVALVDPVTTGSALGFSAQAAVWLGLLALGIVRIRSGDVSGHRAAMLAMAATASGAMFFRVYLGLWAGFGNGRHYRLFYACDAWVAWALPLAVTLWWLRADMFRLKPRAELAKG